MYDCLPYVQNQHNIIFVLVNYHSLQILVLQLTLISSYRCGQLLDYCTDGLFWTLITVISQLTRICNFGDRSCYTLCGDIIKGVQEEVVSFPHTLYKVDPFDGWLHSVPDHDTYCSMEKQSNFVGKHLTAPSGQLPHILVTLHSVCI